MHRATVDLFRSPEVSRGIFGIFQAMGLNGGLNVRIIQFASSY